MFRRACGLLLAVGLLAGCGHPTLTTPAPVLPGGAGTDPTYRGPQSQHTGPVQPDPRVVLVYWGRVWQTGTFQRQVKAAESAMLARLPDSQWGRVLGQYGIHNDVRLLRAWTDPRNPPNRKLGYKAMGDEVLRASRLTGIRSTPNTQWVIFLPPAANLRGFNNECGEHDVFHHAGRVFVYSLIMPFDTRRFGSGRTSCAQYDAWGGNKIAATTSLTSHEIAEAATDPQDLKDGNGSGWWADPAARRFGMGAAEVADFCYGQAIQPWGASGPTVQALWSDRNAGPLRKQGCVASLAGGAPQLVGQTVGLGGHPRPLPAAQNRRLIGGR